MEKIILTTESGSDVPQAMADELGIRIAPMHVILGDESYPCLLYTSGSPDHGYHDYAKVRGPVGGALPLG